MRTTSPNDQLWATLMVRAEEVLYALEPAPGAVNADHMLYVRVPIGSTWVLVWGRRLVTSPVLGYPTFTASPAVHRLADALRRQLDERDLWTGWHEAGWRVGASVRPTLLNALRDNASC